MNSRVQRYLDEHFELGKRFLLTREALLAELTGTFEAELWDCLEQQAFLKAGRKMGLPLKPSLQAILARQVLFAWGLGYAVGAARGGVERSSSVSKADH